METGVKIRVSISNGQEQAQSIEEKTAKTTRLEHPNLHLSPEERRYFGQLFAAADTEKIGVVTGEVAVKFFEKTRLPPTTLGEVRTWNCYLHSLDTDDSESRRYGR